MKVMRTTVSIGVYGELNIQLRISMTYADAPRISTHLQVSRIVR